MTDTTEFVVRPLQPPPPLAMVLFWNIFTCIHAIFMLGAVWVSDKRFLLPLLAFYALFFGAGFWMARSWLAWRTIQRRYGKPELLSVPVAEPGQAVKLSVQFDRPWPRNQALVGTLQWVSTWEDMDSDERLDIQPQSALIANINAGQTGTLWSASAIVPARPASLHAGKSALELHFRAYADKGPGWRLAVPLQSRSGAGATSERVSQPLSPRQLAQAEQWLGRAGMVMALVALGWAGYALSRYHVSLLDLLFPLILGLGAYGVSQMRVRVRNGAVSQARDAGPTAAVGRLKGWSSLVFVLFFAGIGQEIFAPDALDHVIARIMVKRPAQPVTFTLPTRLFNGQSMAPLDVQVSGRATLDGNRLSLHLDRLYVYENPADTDRVAANLTRIRIAATRDAGKYVESVGDTPFIPVRAGDRNGAYELGPVDTELTLEPRADLERIWLRLELWGGEDGYTPVDAERGHLARMMEIQ